MDQSPSGFAYRCLPLDIANAHGWEILCPFGFRARWSGEAHERAVEIAGAPDNGGFATSHFGGGILTFNFGYLFRSEPHVSLWVMGPVNRPKDGIQPLCGVIETDWSPYTFTMNWMFTRPDCWIHFEEGEPFCAFFPIPRGFLESVEPEFRLLESNPELKDQYAQWVRSRETFIASSSDPESEATKQGWQKHYFRGVKLDGGREVSDHTSRLHLRTFVDATQPETN